MQTEQPTFRLDDARAPLWFGSDAGWGDAVRAVDPSAAQNARGDDRRRRSRVDGGTAPA